MAKTCCEEINYYLDTRLQMNVTRYKDLEMKLLQVWLQNSK